MRSAEFIVEEYQITNPHIDILISGTWGYRVFYKGTIKPEYRELVQNPVVAQATANFQQHGRICQLDYIISNVNSEEYSSELLDEVLESLRRRHVHKIVAVVDNPDVIQLFNKFGFENIGSSKRGTQMELMLL